MHDKGYFQHCLGLHLNPLRTSKTKVSRRKRISITSNVLLSFHFPELRRIFSIKAICHTATFFPQLKGWQTILEGATQKIF